MIALVEAVCQSVEDAEIAAAAGAGRIELVAALATGGLTPSVGTVAEIKARLLRLPVMAMVRPRPGGFVYSGAEAATMLRDADALLEAGAEGLVFGALKPDQTVDTAFCREMLTNCRGQDAVFHRAFDLAAEPFAALEALIDLGFHRVLTSGQARTAPEGAARLAELRERAAGRIEILPGGGVRASNLCKLLGRTGCDQVHLAPLERVDGGGRGSGPLEYGGYERLDADAVAAAVRAAISN